VDLEEFNPKIFISGKLNDNYPLDHYAIQDGATIMLEIRAFRLSFTGRVFLHSQPFFNLP
jgi:hypothetical protein